MEEAAVLHDVDHRTTVARLRRERTRSRLLDAVLRIWPDGQANEPTVIRTVADAAGVSRATFYKHFVSLDAAAAALGRRLADEMVAELQPIQHEIDDARVRASIGIQIFLWRGVHDPVWGRFVARSRHFAADGSRYVDQISRNLLDGRQQHGFAFDRIDAALAVSIGALKEGLTVLTEGVHDPSGFIAGAAVMILLGLGDDQSAARHAADEGARHIARCAPALYPWWRRGTPLALAPPS